ncbi:MAG: signal recognition particle protein [Rhizobiales bacterium]|nr:signal recognition particle protein [Hyphomicrobiales bacterium]NRB14614.1 signal recognition particle protein [Hyphomicrobiales bacterium]
MFESLSDRLGEIFDKITGRGALSESDVNAAMREIRRALIEADVALDVVKAFIATVKKQAIGAAVVKSVKPGQMVVKIVHDELVAMLGEEAVPLNLNAVPPVGILLVGLQGSGKTTMTAKIAKRLTERDRKKVLMASLDVYRPAAQEQLAILGKSIDVDTLPIVEGQKPLDIAKRAQTAAKLGGYDVLMIDTAGRLHIDNVLMAEIVGIRDIIKPQEVLLVADSLTGQDAVNVARVFNEQVGATGIALTRIDGDGRGGAALSMRAVTGCPIKYLGTGEKPEDLDLFDPKRVAGRILGMGDIVALVEKAAEAIDAEKAEAMAKKMRKGQFDLNDLSDQLKQMEKMGGMGGVMSLLPGIGKMKKQLAGANLDDDMFKYQMAIISSMTKRERRNPKVLNASRKKRVAAGCGRGVPEINKLLKMHRQMADMMKKMAKGGRGGMLGNMFGGGGQGMPEIDTSALTGQLPDVNKLEEMQKQLGGSSGGLSGLGGGLPGLGGAKSFGGLPGLGGLPSGKKK